MTNWFIEDDDEEYKPWTMADIYADLGSLSDICRTLDVSIYRVDRWIERRDRIGCPAPVARIGHTDAYSMQQWKDWFRGWVDKKRPGRREDSKWVDTKPHDAGKPFFTYTPGKDDPS